MAFLKCKTLLEEINVEVEPRFWPDQVVIVIQTHTRQVELNNAGAKKIQFWLKIVDEIQIGQTTFG